jgi:hypothetical protein
MTTQIADAYNSGEISFGVMRSPVCDNRLTPQEKKIYDEAMSEYEPGDTLSLADVLHDK